MLDGYYVGIKDVIKKGNINSIPLTNEEKNKIEIGDIVKITNHYDKIGVVVDK